MPAGAALACGNPFWTGNSRLPGIAGTASRDNAALCPVVEIRRKIGGPICAVDGSDGFTFSLRAGSSWLACAGM
jgi:hypothetical protein